MLVKSSVQLFALFLIIITENGLTKALYLANDVPGAVVADILHDILQQPFQHNVSGLQVFYQLLDGQFFNLIVVKPDAQVGCQVKLTGEITQYALEECVDGLDAEVIIVVE